MKYLQSGGTGTASTPRLFIHFSIETVSAFGLRFLTSHVALVAFSAVRGIGLSHDYGKEFINLS